MFIWDGMHLGFTYDLRGNAHANHFYSESSMSQVEI